MREFDWKTPKVQPPPPSKKKRKRGRSREPMIDAWDTGGPKALSAVSLAWDTGGPVLADDTYIEPAPPTKDFSLTGCFDALTFVAEVWSAGYVKCGDRVVYVDQNSATPRLHPDYPLITARLGDEKGETAGIAMSPVDPTSPRHQCEGGNLVRVYRWDCFAYDTFTALAPYGIGVGAHVMIASHPEIFSEIYVWEPTCGDWIVGQVIDVQETFGNVTGRSVVTVKRCPLNRLL